MYIAARGPPSKISRARAERRAIAVLGTPGFSLAAKPIDYKPVTAYTPEGKQWGLRARLTIRRDYETCRSIRSNVFNPSFMQRTQDMPRAVWFFVTIGAIYLATLYGFDFLRFPIYGDEDHFWPTTLYLFQDGLPSLDRLRNYNELNTPLPFLVFGVVEHYLGGGIIVGRFINFLTSFAVVAIIGAAGRFSFHSLLCAIGLLACPYFFAVSTHLYTDILAVAFVVLGILFYLKKHSGRGAVFFSLAICCRQYAIVFPVGTILNNLVNRRASGLTAWDFIAPGLASLTLGAWILLFGATAPRIALEAQHIEVGRLFPAHGIYFLTCVGFYFVVVEIILFRSLVGLRDFKFEKLALALIVTAVCVLKSPDRQPRSAYSDDGLP